MGVLLDSGQLEESTNQLSKTVASLLEVALGHRAHDLVDSVLEVVHFLHQVHREVGQRLQLRVSVNMALELVDIAVGVEVVEEGHASLEEGHQVHEARIEVEGFEFLEQSCHLLGISSSEAFFANLDVELRGANAVQEAHIRATDSVHAETAGEGARRHEERLGAGAEEHKNSNSSLHFNFLL